MTEENLNLLTNKNLLELLEDGWKANQVMRDDDMAIWKSENSKTGKKAVAVFNLSEEGCETVIPCDSASKEVKAMDVWSGQEILLNKDSRFTIEKHSVKTFIY